MSLFNVVTDAIASAGLRGVTAAEASQTAAIAAPAQTGRSDANNADEFSFVPFTVVHVWPIPTSGFSDLDNPYDKIQLCEFTTDKVPVGPLSFSTTITAVPGNPGNRMGYNVYAPEGLG